MQYSVSPSNVPAAGAQQALQDVGEKVRAPGELEAGALELDRRTAALRSAGRLARVGGWEIDCRTGMVNWSEEAVDLLGSPTRELDLATAMNIYRPEDRPRILEIFDRARTRAEPIEYEAWARTYDGDEIYLRVLGEVQCTDDGGQFLRGAAVDLTRDAFVRQKLQEAEEFSRGIVDGVAAALCVIDATGEILTVNEAWRAFGSSNGAAVEGDYVGENYLDVCRRSANPSALRVCAGIEAVLQVKRDTFDYDYACHAPHEKRWFKVRVAPLAGGGPVRAVILHQNITELKMSAIRLRQAVAVQKRALRAAQAASEAKSAFLATMSHEIRTPLNAVMGMAQAMAAGDLSPVQADRLNVIQQGSQTLLTLLNDILDLSRVEAGGIELEDGVIDLREVMEELRTTFLSLARDKDLVFSYALDQEAAGLWQGDPTRVRQILTNLVGNAVKFTPRGSVHVSASVELSLVVLRVKDTGPGIDADRRDRIFDRFVQADASATRRFGGTGLGLAICRELAHLMGGDVAVDSGPGRGATFSLKLPLRPLGVGCSMPPSPVAEQPLLDQPLSILAAEDNPTNQLVLATLLETLGMAATMTGNGEEVVEAWRGANWDVILMDIQMPVLDGIAATVRIRELERTLGRARTPIIALTANAMTHHVAEYRQAGMDGFVAKPISVPNLLAALASHCSSASETQAQCA